MINITRFYIIRDFLIQIAKIAIYYKLVVNHK